MQALSLPSHLPTDSENGQDTHYVARSGSGGENAEHKSANRYSPLYLLCLIPATGVYRQIAFHI